MNATTTARHTPGPWKTHVGASWQVVTVFGQDGKYIGKLDAYPVRDLGTNDANAKLIAAAPDMLEALRQIATYDPTKLDAATLGNIARDALVKATS